MAKNDLPCSGCGVLMARVAGSLPAGQARCHGCRRVDREHKAAMRVPRSWVCRLCGVMGELPIGTRARTPTRCQECRSRTKASQSEWRLETRTCAHCTSEFLPSAQIQLYCGALCRRRARESRQSPDHAPVPQVATALVSRFGVMAWQAARVYCERWVGWVAFCPECDELMVARSKVRVCLSCATEVELAGVMA